MKKECIGHEEKKRKIKKTIRKSDNYRFSVNVRLILKPVELYEY